MEKTRTMTLLNSLGDVTIIWNKEQDQAVKEMIKDKIEKGIRFFVLKKIPHLPLFRREIVTDPDNITNRRIDLKDEALEKLVQSGTVTLANLGEDTMEFVRATKDVNEIVSTNTAAMPQFAGG